MDRVTSDLGILWHYLDFQIEGIAEAYRMVFPVPERVATQMGEEELWFQIEHQATEILTPKLMGLTCNEIRRGIITDTTALAVLDRKALESIAAEQFGLILP